MVNPGTPVALTTATLGAEIRYTTDGTTPDRASALYSSGNKPRITANNTVIKAIAYKEGMNPSDMLTTPPYTLAFTVTPATIPFTSEITLSDAIDHINANPGAYTIAIAANSISTAPLPALANGVNLTLAGTGTITKNTAGVLFTVNGGAALTLNGPTLNGGNLGGNGVVVGGGNFTLQSGTIKDNADAPMGGGVCMTGGNFTMNGGTISGNQATGMIDGHFADLGLGGGVYFDSGVFTYTGGTISSDNIAEYAGKRVVRKLYSGGSPTTFNGSELLGSPTGSGGSMMGQWNYWD